MSKINEIVRVIREEEGIKLRQPGSICSLMVTPETVGSRHATLGILRLEPSKKTKPNIHPACEEIFYVTRGKGKITVEGESRNIEAGLAIYIPPNAWHEFENVGKETLEFLLILAPPLPKENLNKSPWKPMKNTKPNISCV